MLTFVHQKRTMNTSKHRVQQVNVPPTGVKQRIKIQTLCMKEAAALASNGQMNWDNQPRKQPGTSIPDKRFY
ncbi:hypothetical protein EWK04_13700 [Salmonella enterica subsp. enterica serovar Java]|uniref:Uncharacterized protein n=1 Tax=Salmonella enterica subsp. enterica serovar Java TaxID=224729 RepID=A0A3Y9BX63_SALEB|nr:hypothetical protein [Salmonella enterica subsp. enterica serovar Java]EBY3555204.1 hypothetical protein [Salmonella enterica subsp. enterica serovar Muenchen]ECG3199814.1 hypothetical protein [Salmonella enterica subsp. enterica serovar Java]